MGLRARPKGLSSQQPKHCSICLAGEMTYQLRKLSDNIDSAYLWVVSIGTLLRKYIQYSDTSFEVNENL